MHDDVGSMIRGQLTGVRCRTVQLQPTRCPLVCAFIYTKGISQKERKTQEHTTHSSICSVNNFSLALFLTFCIFSLTFSRFEVSPGGVNTFVSIRPSANILITSSSTLRKVSSPPGGRGGNGGSWVLDRETDFRLCEDWEFIASCVDRDAVQTRSCRIRCGSGSSGSMCLYSDESDTEV